MDIVRKAGLTVATCVTPLWAGTVLAGNNLNLNQGLVAYYPFDEGSGAVVHDRSGNGNEGKILGGVKWAKGALEWK